MAALVLILVCVALVCAAVWYDIYRSNNRDEKLRQRISDIDLITRQEIEDLRMERAAAHAGFLAFLDENEGKRHEEFCGFAPVMIDPRCYLPGIYYVIHRPTAKFIGDAGRKLLEKIMNETWEKLKLEDSAK